MGSIINLVTRRFILRLLWVAFLTTFGIQLLLTVLPAKQLVDPKASLTDEAVTVRKWNSSHYLAWAGKVVQGDMEITDKGTGSWEVKDFIFRVKNSLVLCMVSFLVASIMGGILGAYRASLNYDMLSGSPDNLANHTSRLSESILFLLSSVPSYVIAYTFFMMFKSESNLFLAVIALALGSGNAMDVARMTKNTHSRELRLKYVESAIANGLKTKGLLPMPGYVSWHAFRNTLITILPVTALRLPLILSSAMMVEIVFDMPGMGESLLKALIGQDIPKILSIVLVSTVFVQVCLFIAELMAFLLHPKAGMDS